jgi:hypothetical protein
VLQVVRPDGAAASHAPGWAGGRLADLIAAGERPGVERRAA